MVGGKGGSFSEGGPVPTGVEQEGCKNHASTGRRPNPQPATTRYRVCRDPGQHRARRCWKLKPALSCRWHDKRRHRGGNTMAGWLQETSLAAGHGEPQRRLASHGFGENIM